MIHAIKDFIKRELKKGYSLPIIKQELKNKGFAVEDVNTAVTELTYHKSNILSLTVIFLGLFMFDMIIIGIFMGIPFLFTHNSLLKYFSVFFVSSIIGLSNLWVMRSITENSAEKNSIGMLVTNIIVFILHAGMILAAKIAEQISSSINLIFGANVSSQAITSLPNLYFISITFFVIAYAPFFYENITEKNSALKWMIISAMLFAIMLILASTLKFT